MTVRPAKRNASTESLDLLNRSPPECSCAVYSPNSIDGNKCRKCSQGRQALTTTGQRAQKKYNSSKYKDASTSPKSNSPLRVVPTEPKSPRSPKSPRAEASTDTKFDFPCSPRTESHYKRLSTLSINSGQKNVGTSPKKHPVSPNKLTPVKNDRVLEKSNSLGESKPQKQLRTTRSLSPRPPVKHQHSIMVSDENDIVSVKLSPNEEFDETKEKGKVEDEKTAKKKAHSEANSPNLSDCGSLKLEDSGLKNVNNRSTSCLVYVPSDPWTRMSAIQSPIPTKKQQEPHQKAKKLASKSFSKPNLEYLEDSDPWVYRSNIVLNEQAVKKKGSLPHQTKSLSSALSRDGGFDNARAQRLCQQRSLTKFDKTLTIPGIDLHFDARKKITRPKLQRSKSPAFYEELFQPEKGTPTPSKSLSKNKSVSSLKIEKNASNSNLNNGAKCTCHTDTLGGRPNNHMCCDNVYKSSNSITSPTIKKQQSSPKLCIPQSPPTNNQPELVKASLTVLNPNLLQPRHSFSTTPSQKDDELQLNIRRLSEQMNKYHHHSGAGTVGGYFSHKQQAPSFMNDTIPPPPLDKSKKSSSGGVTTSAGGGSGGLLVSSGSSNTLLIEPAAGQKQRASSHSKINEPIMETRC